MNIRSLRKRWIAGILAVCAICVSCGFAAASEEMQEEEEQKITTSANLEFLNRLGILLFDEDDGFDGGAEMTRAEFAREAVLLLNENEDIYENLEIPYTDVDEYTEGVGAILLLTERNIINGYGDGTFGPDDGISTNEATVLAMRMLGYDAVGDGWNALWIRSKIGFSEDRPLTRGDAAELFERVLNAECVEYSAFGNNPNYSVKRTFLEVHFGLEKRTGKVTATRYTSLEQADGVPQGYAEIDGERYLTSFELSDLIGYRVKYYVRENAQKESELVYAEPNGTQVTYIPAEDLLDFNQQILRYEVGSRVRNLTVPSDVDVIYNGRACPRYTAEQIKILQGSVTVLENNGKVETLIVEDIKDEVVASVLEDTVYLRSGKKITPSDYEIAYSAVDTEGEPLAVDKMAEGLILSIMESADAEYIHIVASAQTVKGKVTVLSEDKATIEDTVYEPSPYMENEFSSIEVGRQYSFSLNAYGKIVVIKSRSAEEEFAYLLNMTASPLGTLKLGILTQDSRLTHLPVANKLTFNGRTVSAEQLAAELQKDGKADRQLIRIRVDADGAIKQIDTAVNRGSYNGSVAELNELDGLHISCEGNGLRYKTATKTFQGLAPLNANTIVFFVRTDSAEQLNSDNFYSGVSGYLVNDGIYTFTAYSVEGGTRAADAVVIYNKSESSSIEETAPLSIVMERMRVVDEDGVEQTGITVLKDKKELSLMLDESIDPDNITGANAADSRTYQLSPGDAIRFAVNSKGKIGRINMVYDVADNIVDGHGFSYTTSTTGSLTDLKYRLLCGDVYDIDNGILSISKKDLKAGDNVSSLLVTNMENFQSYSSCPVYLCSRNRGGWNVQVSSAAALIPYTHAPDAYSKVIVTTQYGTPILMVVYQEN